MRLAAKVFSKRFNVVRESHTAIGLRWTARPILYPYTGVFYYLVNICIQRRYIFILRPIVEFFLDAPPPRARVKAGANHSRLLKPSRALKIKCSTSTILCAPVNFGFRSPPE